MDKIIALTGLIFVSIIIVVIVYMIIVVICKFIKDLIE